MEIRGLVLKTCAAAVFGLFSLQATAAAVTYDLDIVFSTGAVVPDGPTPYATVTFDDFGGTGSVEMTVAIAASVGDAKMTELYLNLDPGLNFSLLSFDYEIGSSGPAASTPVGVGTDAFKADGDGLYDIFFNFPTSMNTFDADETVVYTITSSEAISASSFGFFSTPDGGEGTFIVASKWQTTGPDGEDSAWVGAVPVPAAVWLFGSGLLGLVGVARRKRA